MRNELLVGPEVLGDTFGSFDDYIDEDKVSLNENWVIIINQTYPVPASRRTSRFSRAFCVLPMLLLQTRVPPFSFLLPLALLADLNACTRRKHTSCYLHVHADFYSLARGENLIFFTKTSVSICFKFAKDSFPKIIKNFFSYKRNSTKVKEILHLVN